MYEFLGNPWRLGCKFGVYKVKPFLQFMSVRLQWAIRDCSGASMFLFVSHVFWVGRTDTFLGQGILWN